MLLRILEFDFLHFLSPSSFCRQFFSGGFSEVHSDSQEKILRKKIRSASIQEVLDLKVLHQKRVFRQSTGSANAVQSVRTKTDYQNKLL